MLLINLMFFCLIFCLVFLSYFFIQEERQIPASLVQNEGEIYTKNINTEVKQTPLITGVKRPIPSSHSSEILDENPKEEIPSIKKPSRKIGKVLNNKVTSREEIVLQMNDTKVFFNESNKNYPLDYSKTIDFLFETFGKQNSFEIATKYTTGIPALIKLLSDIQAKSTEPKLQRRLHRIKNWLEDTESQEKINNSWSETESEANTIKSTTIKSDCHNGYRYYINQ